MEAKEFNKHLKNAECNQYSLIKLYNEYYPKIVLHISVRFDNSIAHDIAQEFFCKILDGRFNTVSYIYSPTAWIYRICDNIAINVYNKESKYVSISDFVFSDEKQDLDRMLDIRELLCSLDDVEKKIIYFHFFEGYSLKELADMFDIKYDNFRKKYGAILKKIKRNISI